MSIFRLSLGVQRIHGTEMVISEQSEGLNLSLSLRHTCVLLLAVC